METKTINPKYGEVYMANMAIIGNVQGGKRPVVIVQNNIGNTHSPTVSVVPLTSRTKTRLPTHVVIGAGAKTGLEKNSVALAEQTQTINKTSLTRRLGAVEEKDMQGVRRAMRVQFAF